MSLKVAIVGCGQIADGHVEEIQKLDCAHVVGVCDLEPLMAEQLASRYGIPHHYDDFGRLLREAKPDVVHVASPPQSHMRLALEAMESGCHVYVEKPFALNHEEARRIIDCAQQKRRKVTIGHTFEFDQAAVELSRLVERGVVGVPLHVESFFGYNLSGSFGSAIFSNHRHWVHALPGRLFQNNINHLLSRIYPYIADERPVIHVAAYLRRPQRFGDGRDATLDELRLMIQGESVSGFACFSSHVKPTANFVRVYGSRSTAHADFVSRTVTVDRQSSVPGAVGRVVGPFLESAKYLRAGGRNLRRFLRSDLHYFDGLNRLIRMFYASILNDTEPPIAYRDILRVTRWMDDIFGQIDHGGLKA